MLSKRRISTIEREVKAVRLIPGSPYRHDDGLDGEFAMAMWRGVRENVPLYITTLETLMELGQEVWQWDAMAVFAHAAIVALTPDYPEAGEYRHWFLEHGWPPARLVEWVNQDQVLDNLCRFEALAYGEATRRQPLQAHLLNRWRV